MSFEHAKGPLVLTKDHRFPMSYWQFIFDFDSLGYKPFNFVTVNQPTNPRLSAKEAVSRWQSWPTMCPSHTLLPRATMIDR